MAAKFDLPSDNTTHRAVRLFQQGKDPQFIIVDLVTLGVEKEYASKVVARVVELLGKKSDEDIAKDHKSDGKGAAIWGGTMLVLGLAITFGSASAASGGGYYVMTYGLIIGGAIMLVRGLSRMR